MACFTTGDHQFKSACIRITNLFGSGFSSSLPPAWNKPDRRGGDGSDRELVPSFSRDIFLVATLLEVLGVYTDWRSAGGRRRIPSADCTLSSDVFTQELCNASTCMANYSCKWTLHRRERRGHLCRKIEQTEPDTLIPGWDWEKVSKVVAWNFCQCLVGPSIQFFSLKVVLMLGGIMCIVSIKRLIVCH